MTDYQVANSQNAVGRIVVIIEDCFSIIEAIAQTVTLLSGIGYKPIRMFDND